MCDNVRHFAGNFIHKKDFNEEKDALKPQVNVVTTDLGQAGPNSTSLVITNFEINFISYSSLDWYIDTCGTVHVWYNISFFSFY